ncbi:TonB-dependent receptor [Algoriphagus sp. CAU 1675]|uniref:TonB-dependent receptor n=1 Tax=Algoriphagus sp. CAU 1675 TaxID=3032597 RepID=UPI0023DB24F5|nr:TonB-dependent receptor [Algoriphagus sp. CAU 1675]MDF2157703.1 TonB-dependent receptor [Algoriphagus sp. CAU 1675]
MKKLSAYISSAAIVLGFVGNLQAQTQSRGEVQDQEFVIRKDRVLTVPVQPRVFEKLPILPQPKGLDQFSYTVNFYELNLPPVQLEASPVQKSFRPERLDLYPGFLKAGYGNFASPLVEAGFMATEVVDFNYALQLRHQSFGKGPVLGEQSNESHSNASFDGSYFTDQVEIFGGLGWKQDSYSFYGIDTSVLNDPRIDFAGIQDNVLNTVQVHAGIRDIEKVGPVSYEAELGFRNFKDSYLVQENQISGKAKGIFRPADNWLGKVGLEYFYTDPVDRDYDVTRTYFAIRPSVGYSTADFSVTAGINVVSENDPVPGKSSDFRIFPNFKASYQFAEEFGFYGEFSGDVQRNTYYSFVQENPFMGPSAQLLNTINNYKVAGGIEGQFLESFNYRAGIDLSRYNQYHFFVNTPADTSRFNLVYDDKVTVANLNAELGYSFSDMYKLTSRLDLFKYDLNLQQEAWHRPIWKMGLNNQITPIDQLLVQVNINLMGGVKARGNLMETNVEEPQEYETIKLKTITDLHLKADYKVSDRIGVFAEGNNLLNSRNMRWLNYPVRGVQLIGGVWLKF